MPSDALAGAWQLARGVGAACGSPLVPRKTSSLTSRYDDGDAVQGRASGQYGLTREPSSELTGTSLVRGALMRPGHSFPFALRVPQYPRSNFRKKSAQNLSHAFDWFDATSTIFLLVLRNVVYDNADLADNDGDLVSGVACPVSRFEVEAVNDKSCRCGLDWTGLPHASHHAPLVGFHGRVVWRMMLYAFAALTMKTIKTAS